MTTNEPLTRVKSQATSHVNHFHQLGSEILQWCHDHGVRYLNTSVELWDPYYARGSRACSSRCSSTASGRPTPGGSGAR